MRIKLANGMSPLIRKPKDFWSGIIFAVTGLAAVMLATDYPMGTATKMGPAYFPTVLGGLLVLIGLMAIIRSLLTIGRSGEPIERFALKEAFLILFATVLFGALVRGAGLAVALPVLLLLSAYASIKFRWGPSLALAAGLTVFCILIFVKALGIPLPILGSWFDW